MLGRFRSTRVWGEQLNTFLLDTGARLTAVAQAIPELCIVAVIFVLARLPPDCCAISSTVSRRAIDIGWLDARLGPVNRR